MARLTQTQWRELIAEQAQSSLTATAFCAARGINPKYFSLRKNQPDYISIIGFCSCPNTATRHTYC
ncbi:MAG: hypothetical protein U5M23_03960 [Marinagarivorans sp.]|nr:hypothetical protein [Marinagarivorans sp.]